MAAGGEGVWFEYEVSVHKRFLADVYFQSPPHVVFFLDRNNVLVL